jgi:2-methylfumaryl-CoA isomerase
MYQLLSGLRIIELSAFVAAPLGGMTLAQLGADVIRIDPPGGGLDYRRWPVNPEGDSLYWRGLNKGKRSAVIDIARPEGRELVTDLIVAGDGILLTNFPARGWLSYETLKKRRPDLLMMNILGNADGSTAVDYTINCAVGVPYATGNAMPDRPVNHMLPAWDLITGNMAVIGLLAAERHRQRTGEGQLIKLSLADVAMAAVGHLGHIAEAERLKRDRVPIGNDLYGAFGRDFATSDGRRLMVVAITTRQWSALLEATGAGPALAGMAAARNLDLSTEGGRFEARDSIAEVLAPWCQDRTLVEIASIFDEHGVCWGPYQSFTQMVSEDPRCSTKNPMFQQVDHPGVGLCLTPGSPFSFSELRRGPIKPAPALGQHTSQVLAEANISAGEIARLRTTGIVGSD